MTEPLSRQPRVAQSVANIWQWENFRSTHQILKVHKNQMNHKNHTSAYMQLIQLICIMHALGIMVLFLVIWINGIWFVTCLHFVFDWLTKSDDSIFAEISFSHKIYCCSPPQPARDWISRAGLPCLVNHRVLSVDLSRYNGWRLNNLLPPDRKTGLHRSLLHNSTCKPPWWHNSCL